jgi:hypothetical protein
MPFKLPFFSVNEPLKPEAHRVYHSNSLCGPGQEIREEDRVSGTNNYRLCEDCKKLNDADK